MELEYATNRQLIDELLSRNSFVGVVVHHKHDLRGEAWDGRGTEFLVSSNTNMDSEQTAYVLREVANYMEGTDAPTGSH